MEDSKDLISKLSEIRNEYNCFDEDEEPQYRALSEAIKILSQRADGDTISRQAAITAANRADYRGLTIEDVKKVTDEVVKELKQLPPAQPEQRWIPIKWHDCTDEDREKYGFSNDIVVVFDCEMPDDDQSILVTTSHGYVYQDACYIDDGYSLDSGFDWIDDVKAWMPLPEPYKEEGEME